MELISTYLLNQIQTVTTDIRTTTFRALRLIEWYYDARSGEKFVLLNKRFLVGNKYYRVLIRFELDKTGLSSYTLSLPCPFLITECEVVDNDKWKDTKVYHGRKLKNTIGYINAGVPIDLIETVYAELESTLVYH